MFFKRKDNEAKKTTDDETTVIDKTCLVCGKRVGAVPIDGGFVCQYCVPLTERFDNPTATEVEVHHIKDQEILDRIDSFTETGVFGELRFDDTHRLFFKGPWPSYSIPVLSYAEILGYTILFDDKPMAFNSTQGERAILTNCTDEYIKNSARTIDKITLEVESSRPNVTFAPYEIRGAHTRISETREGCIRIAIDISRKFDTIIEDNIISMHN